MSNEAKFVEPVFHGDEKPAYTLWQLVAYALGLGTWGFGGPVALIGYMHRDLVERRKWISETQYKEGLTLAQIMPGPLAAQLGMYLGYVHYRILGATLVGIAFVLPSFLMVVALGWAYSRYGGLSWMQAVFYGVGSAVIGIIAISATKLTKKTNGGDTLLWLIYLVSAGVTIVTESEFVPLFIVAGLITWQAKARPKIATSTAPAFLPIGLAVAHSFSLDGELLLRVGLFFAKAGAFVFGSGLAIVPFLYSGVVKEYGWLNDQQFLDAVAVAMITPGPVVITVGFIGYLVAGLAGAIVAAIGTFLPCYVFTVLPAPYFHKHGKRPGIVAFVEGVTAAAVGAIAGAVVVLGRRTLFNTGWQLDWFKAGLAIATVCILLRYKKIPEPLIVLAAAVIGLVAFPLVRP